MKRQAIAGPGSAGGGILQLVAAVPHQTDPLAPGALRQQCTEVPAETGENDLEIVLTVVFDRKTTHHRDADAVFQALADAAQALRQAIQRKVVQREFRQVDAPAGSQFQGGVDFSKVAGAKNVMPIGLLGLQLRSGPASGIIQRRDDG
nr:hypothetical protein [Marinobacterium rhizophilum]